VLIASGRKKNCERQTDRPEKDNILPFKKNFTPQVGRTTLASQKLRARGDKGALKKANRGKRKAKGKIFSGKLTKPPRECRLPQGKGPEGKRSKGLIRAREFKVPFFFQPTSTLERTWSKRKGGESRRRRKTKPPKQGGGGARYPKLRITRRTGKPLTLQLTEEYNKKSGGPDKTETNQKRRTPPCLPRVTRPAGEGGKTALIWRTSIDPLPWGALANAKVAA